jgi:polar amino acid transport system substrate-binding protein
MKMGSPRTALAALLLAVAVTAGVGARAGAASQHIPVPPPLYKCKELVKSEVKVRGKLTVATDSPALAPWFVSNDPANGQGYEAAVAYRVATLLGFKTSQVVWYSEPYWLSETPGAKPFDFDINEIIYNAKLTTNVTFSQSYFNVNQSLVSVKGDAIIANHTPHDLKTYLYGDVKGTGLAYITSKIHPTRAPIVYSTISLAISALEAKKIDAIVIDTPSGQYIASQQLTDGVQVAQFHTTSEHYALVFQRADPLAMCVDSALASLTKKGQLTTFSKKYLSIYNSIPVIKP